MDGGLATSLCWIPAIRAGMTAPWDSRLKPIGGEAWLVRPRAMLKMDFPSVGMPVHETDERGPDQDSQVQAKRPILDVVIVVRDPPFHFV